MNAETLPDGNDFAEGKYAKGAFLVRSDAEGSAWLKEFISTMAFLNVDEARRIPTHNKRYRVYNLGIPDLGGECIMKVSWTNPEYHFRRRLNVRLLQIAKDYSKIALRGAEKLRRAGVATITPLGCWRYRKSCIDVESYLIYRKIPADFSIREWRLKTVENPTEENRRVLDVLIDKMADIMAKIHGSGLKHDDVASGNFLVKTVGPAGDGGDLWSQYRVSVIDTDHVVKAFPWPRFLRRILALKCMRRLDFDESGRRRFLGRYMGAEYSEFWWRVLEFWKKGGNRPLKTGLRQLSGGKK